VISVGVRRLVLVMPITVEVPDPLAERLAAEAVRCGVGVDQLTLVEIEDHLRAHRPADESGALPAFVGSFDSGDPDWGFHRHSLAACCGCRAPPGLMRRAVGRYQRLAGCSGSSLPHHEACAVVLSEHMGELASVTPVIAETGWLLLDRAGPAAQATFVAMVAAGALEPVELTGNDRGRVHRLVTTYADLSLDLIDPATIAVAERLGLTTIATLDHRDFRTVRPVHVGAFSLIP
jgi:uncharacterized protein